MSHPHLPLGETLSSPNTPCFTLHHFYMTLKKGILMYQKSKYSWEDKYFYVFFLTSLLSKDL